MQVNSPRAISLYISILTALISTVILLLIVLFADITIKFWMPFALFAFLFVIIFFLVFYSIKKFVYNRIKLLYRSTSIFRSKKALLEMDLDMRTDILEKVSRDVAEWMVEQHRTIDQLEERESFRREFIGNLSHELKTPVFSIQGYILTLLEGGINDPDINVKFLEKAAIGVDRITRLLDDLDAISKMESGQINIAKERFDFAQLAKQVVDEIENKAERKEIKITIRFSSEKSIWVDADPGKISQVLTNLIINAINYGKKGGYIYIKSHEIGDKILIEVEDNGIGMDKEETPRIFERFYRVDKSRARQKGGTGLGLAIVKHIIESHDESITVRSSPEEGSIFSFSLTRA